MKKLISLIASIAMLASMVTSVSAASLLANNKPVVGSTVTELTAEQYEYDWVGEPLPAGQKAYVVDVDLSGLDLDNVASGTTNLLKKKRTGTLLMYASYELKFESMANVVSIMSVDGLATPTTEENKALAILSYNSATTGYPTTVDGDPNTGVVTETAKKLEGKLYQFLVVVKGEVVATPYSEVKVTYFEKDVSKDTLNFGASEAQQASYTVNGKAATTITFGVPEENIVVGDRYDLASGYAWDVTINKFEEAHTYTATFTDGDDTKVNDFNFENIAEVEQGAKVSFVALLKAITKTRPNVKLNVTEK